MQSGNLQATLQIRLQNLKKDFFLLQGEDFLFQTSLIEAKKKRFF